MDCPSPFILPSSIIVPSITGQPQGIAPTHPSCRTDLIYRVRLPPYRIHHRASPVGLPCPHCDPFAGGRQWMGRGNPLRLSCPPPMTLPNDGKEGEGQSLAVALWRHLPIRPAAPRPVGTRFIPSALAPRLPHGDKSDGMNVVPTEGTAAIEFPLMSLYHGPYPLPGSGVCVPFGILTGDPPGAGVAVSCTPGTFCITILIW